MSGPTVAAARVDTAEVRSLGVMPVKAEPVNASADDAASTASAAHFRALAIVVRSWMKTVLRRGAVGFVCPYMFFRGNPSSKRVCTTMQERTHPPATIGGEGGEEQCADAHAGASLPRRGVCETVLTRATIWVRLCSAAANAACCGRERRGQRAGVVRFWRLRLSGAAHRYAFCLKYGAHGLLLPVLQTTPRPQSPTNALGALGCAM